MHAAANCDLLSGMAGLRVNLDLYTGHKTPDYFHKDACQVFQSWSLSPSPNFPGVHSLVQEHVPGKSNALQAPRQVAYSPILLLQDFTTGDGTAMGRGSGHKR